MAVSKKDLLAYFATLDVKILERLKKYASYIIVPEEDLLTNATMSTMVDKAHSLADSLFPEWTDRSKSDFGEFLVELFALFSEKDFWYINAFANEGTFRKIRSYSNAFSKASSLGYSPITCEGAKADFNVTFAAGEEITYERGELVVLVGGKEFTNDEAFSVPEAFSSTTKRLVLHEGAEVTEDVTYNGYCVFLRKKNIDYNSLSVSVDGFLYERVNNFGESGESSLHYRVLPEQDGSCAIYFGSDGFGYTPEFGKVVHVEYRLCNGSDGNQLQADADINNSLSEREALSAEMLGNATGGTYAESLTAIKEKAPMFFNVKKAIINETVAKQVLDSYPFVHKSNIVVQGYNIFYQVIPSSGYAEITAAQKAVLEEDYEKCIMLGYALNYSQNNYVDFMRRCNPFATKVVIQVGTLLGTKASVVEAAVIQAMEDLTNPLVFAEYGGGFSKSGAEKYIKSLSPGVQSVRFTVAQGGLQEEIEDFTLTDTEIFSKINSENIEVFVYVV